MRLQMSGGGLHGVSCGRAQQMPDWISVQWCLRQGGHCCLQQGMMLNDDVYMEMSGVPQMQR